MNTLDQSSPLARTAVRRGAVHYGSLSFSKRAQPSIDQAFAYLSHDGVARALIERAEHARLPHRIMLDSYDDDSYEPETRVIRWDPHSAMRTTEGGRQSPALGLAHELDHATQPVWTEERLQSWPDAAYDSREERRVITGSEAHIARTLGEARRYDHDGRCYRVPAPTVR